MVVVVDIAVLVIVAHRGLLMRVRDRRSGVLCWLPLCCCSDQHGDIPPWLHPG